MVCYLDFRFGPNSSRHTAAAMLEFRLDKGGGMSESGYLEKSEMLKWYPTQAIWDHKGTRRVT